MVDERANNRSYHRRRAVQQQLGRGESVVQQQEQQTLTAVSNRSHAHSHAIRSEEGENFPNRPPQLTTTFSRFSTTTLVQSQKTKKHKREPGHQADSLWLLFLILTSLSPDKSLYPPTFNRNLDMETQNLRTLFDPMIGEFCADTSPEVFNKIFNSKMRWRDDTAWYPKAETRANMMLTEQPPLMRGASTTNIPSTVSNNTNGQPSVAEPSIVDYDAIDIFWRQDIEMEKGMPAVYPMQYANSNAGQGCSTSSQMCSGPDVSEQYERDLQLLTEKSLFTPLTNEENFRYENLSKAHYADFYRTIPPAAAKRWQSATNASSTSGYSNNEDQFRPASPTKSNISSFDENEAASFFSNLAKQSMLEDNRPNQMLSAPQPLPTYSNLTLCADQSNLLNNVSLAQESNLSGAYANDTFLMPNANGIRGSAVEESEIQDPIAEDILGGINDQPLEISETEANAIWSTMQNSDDLSDAVQIPEFTAMEMLGEFQHNDTIDKRVDSPIPENILTYVERETSPSSGIGSMQSSSSSPNHNEDYALSENDENAYRFYDKLAPKIRNQHNSFSTDASADSFKRPQSNYQRKQSKTRSVVAETGAQRKRGRQSKDEQLAQDHQLPASAEEFAAMSHMQIQGYLRDAKLTPLQKSLIKKIRRRGRNKVAARKCRERRTYPGSVYGQDDYIKEEMESNFDPTDMSLYDF